MTLENKLGITDPAELEGLDNEALVRRYKETGDDALKWALVLRFQDQIRRVALR